MKKLFAYIRNSHAVILKVVLFLCTVAIIVYQLPREGKFKYDLDNLRGKPWPYEDLIASISFPILKSAEEVAAERTAVTEGSRFYYTLNSAIPQTAVTDLETIFHNQWPARYAAYLEQKGLPELRETERKKEAGRQLAKAVEILRLVYENGVIRLDERVEGKDAGFEIFLVTGNVAEEVAMGDLLMLRQVPSRIAGELEGEDDFARSFLQGLLEDVVRPNIFFDQGKTDAVLKQGMDNISLTRGMIQEGERIISKGDVVDNASIMVLVSMKTQYEAKVGGASNYYYILAGQTILVALSMLVLSFFLMIFRRDIIVDNIQIGFVLLLIVMTVGLAAFVVKAGYNIYLVPFCFLPIVMRAFFDTRLALFTHLTAVLVCSIIASNGFEFVFLQFVAGNAAIYSLASMRKRSQFFLSALAIFFSYSITYLGILAIQEGSALTIDVQKFRWFGISASAILLAYPMIYLFEKIFGLVSDVTLMELADLNSPLLRRLSLEAPGTFQHSLQVANLAEEAIYAIGGDALLVRTGALYHDIGKMHAPAFFIENQMSGVNPHDDLPEEESARIIIDHVIKGVEMARKQKLPDKVIDLIRCHHGTTRVEFFLRRFREKHPDKEVEEIHFQYPGPRPFSREAAVLMMADTCEAASRSLKKKDKDSITGLVEGIVRSQLSQDQFNNANITLKDIAATKKIIVKRLQSIYHVRVEYPAAVKGLMADEKV